MPRKQRVGPKWFPSPVWLYTTSRITSIPAWWNVFTMVLNSLTCWPNAPALENRTSGARNPMELYPQ